MGTPQGPPDTWPRLSLACLAAGYFESTKSDWGELLKRSIIIQLFFFLKCKQLNLEKQNPF